MTDDDSDVELSLRGLCWQSEKETRTLIYNLTVPLVRNNVDICLFSLSPDKLKATKHNAADSYLALGELRAPNKTPYHSERSEESRRLRPFAPLRVTVLLGALKGGIDPAGADEHWKTARTALDRIRKAFSDTGASPATFFIGAAVEKKMAGEIWTQLENGLLNNAANLNEANQVASVSRWLCNL
jgi:hypothetical protein